MERATVMRWECIILILQNVRGRQCSPHSERAGRIAYCKWDGTDCASHVASRLGRTTLAIRCAGRDKPRSQYGEWAGTNRTRHMASGTGRTAFAKLVGPDQNSASFEWWRILSFVFPRLFIEEIGFLNLRTCRVISFSEDLLEIPCYNKHFMGSFNHWFRCDQFWPQHITVRNPSVSRRALLWNPYLWSYQYRICCM